MELSPKCGEKRVGEGMITTDGRNYRILLKPGKLRTWPLVWSIGIFLGYPASVRACLDCGLFWGQIDTERLTKFILNHCTEETKQKWGLAGAPDELA